MTHVPPADLTLKQAITWLESLPHARLQSLEYRPNGGNRPWEATFAISQLALVNTSAEPAPPGGRTTLKLREYSVLDIINAVPGTAAAYDRLNALIHDAISGLADPQEVEAHLQAAPSPLNAWPPRHADGELLYDVIKHAHFRVPAIRTALYLADKRPRALTEAWPLTRAELESVFLAAGISTHAYL